MRSADSLAEVVDEFDATVGLDRLRCLHVNDSQTPLGSNRDRHAPLGEGEIGARGCGAFLSEPRFEGLPAIFEGPGVEGKGVAAQDMKRAKELRRNGRAARRAQALSYRRSRRSKPSSTGTGFSKKEGFTQSKGSP